MSVVVGKACVVAVAFVVELIHMHLEKDDTETLTICRDYFCARTSFHRAGRLRQANHQVAIWHRPRPGPTREPRRLWRVIDRTALEADGLELLAGSFGGDREACANDD